MSDDPPKEISFFPMRANYFGKKNIIDCCLKALRAFLALLVIMDSISTIIDVPIPTPGLPVLPVLDHVEGAEGTGQTSSCPQAQSSGCQGKTLP